MTIRYLRSTDGNDADNGTTWALAKATLANAVASSVAGDTVYVSQAHAETTSFVNPAPTTGTAPIMIVGADDSAAPPTAASTAPTITTNGTTINFANCPNTYWYGLNFIAATAINITAAFNGGTNFESCTFQLTAASNAVSITTSGLLVNCGFKFAAASNSIQIGGRAIIRGGGAMAGGTSPTTVFKAFSNNGDFLVEGFDFSNWSSSINLFDPQSGTNNIAGVFRDCKLPASWSGALCTNTASMSPGIIIEMINCSAGSQNYAYRRQTLWGIIDHNTTVKLAASDGTTTLSWKMVSTANSSFPHQPLTTQNIVKWNAAVGNPLTATVEIVTDNVTLKDTECWLEVLYLGSSGTPVSSRSIDRKSTLVATAANQTSSSASWTTTGLGTPVKQKLEVTFTPQMVGYVIARVHLNKASTTVYVDPVLTLA